MARIDTIGLTSPRTRGREVEHAQHQLAHNKFNKKFYDGHFDGVFGNETGLACKQARHELGFPKKQVRRRYDYALDSRLNGERPLGPTYQLRRKKRQRDRQREGNVKVEAVKIGLKKLGVKENPPNSNRVLFTDWYGMVGPWCLMFVTYCFVEAGSKIFAKGQRWAYNPTLTAAAAHGDFGLRFTNDPEHGDLVQYQFDSDPMADHIGIFLDWIQKGSTFRALEGNTAPTNDANGGEVMIRTRTRSLVTHFIRYPSNG